MNRCPSQQLLEQLLDDQLDDVQKRNLTVHIDTCSQCQATLEHMTEDTQVMRTISMAWTGGRNKSTRSEENAPAPFLTNLKKICISSHLASSAIPNPLFQDSQSPSATPTPIKLPSVAGYEIVRELGRGGMGVVYQALQVGLNRQVALKMILPGSHANAKDLSRFRQEAKAIARLHHPNIVQIYDIGDTDGRPYLVLEFVSDGSLVQRLHGNPQPIYPAARLIETLARTIHFAHERHIVHRDLKPANILISSAETARFVEAAPLSSTESTTALTDYGLPKITDFGLAKRLDGESTGTHTGEVIGTPSYMAPEQAASKSEAVGPATDVYSLGAILYEMLTGRPPFKGATALDTIVQVLHEEPVRPSFLRPKLPRDLETICLKCLDKEPSRRYATAIALAEDLYSFRHGSAIRARPVGARERLWKWARRRPLSASLIAGLILVTVLGFAGITWQWQEAALARDTALSEKRAKELEQEEAERARHTAEEARHQEAEQRQKAREALYYSRIAQSQLHWRLNDITSAEQSLEKCRSIGSGQQLGWEWYYLYGLYHTDLFTFAHERSGTSDSVAFRPDGSGIVSVVGGSPASEDVQIGEIGFWDVSQGQCIERKALSVSPSRLAFHPGGHRFVLGTTSGALQFWDADRRQKIFERFHHQQNIAGLAFSSDGHWLASASWDQKIKIWDFDTGKVRHTLRGHQGRVHTVAFHPHKPILASGGQDTRILLWDPQQGRLLKTLEGGHKSAVYCVAFSPDGHFLASSGSNGILKIWDLGKDQVIQSVTGHTGAVLGLAYSPDGRYLAYCGGDTTIRIWSVKVGAEQMILRGHTAAVENVQFSSDGRRLVSSSPLEGAIKIWDLTRHPLYATLARTGSDVEAISFLDQGKSLASLTMNGKLQIWNVASGMLEKEHELPIHPKLISPAVPVAFSSLGSYVAARSREDERILNIWKVASGTLVARCVNHHWPVRCVRFGRNGCLATCGWTVVNGKSLHEVCIWDALAGKCLHTYTGDGKVFTIALSPDNHYLALGLEEGNLSILDLAAHREAYHIIAHNSDVTSVAFSFSGRYLASASVADHKVKIWDWNNPYTERLHLLHILPAQAILCDLAFSPNDQRLAGISRDFVKLWDIQTSQEAITLHGAPSRHKDPPFNPRVLFSPDGKRLAGTNWDESISMWEAHLDEARLSDYQACRREAAQQRASLWHLQEAKYCWMHKNRSATLFHLGQIGQSPLAAPLQVRKDQLLRELKITPVPPPRSRSGE